MILAGTERTTEGSLRQGAQGIIIWRWTGGEAILAAAGPDAPGSCRARPDQGGEDGAKLICYSLGCRSYNLPTARRRRLTVNREGSHHRPSTCLANVRKGTVRTPYLVNGTGRRWPSTCCNSQMYSASHFVEVKRYPIPPNTRMCCQCVVRPAFIAQQQTTTDLPPASSAIQRRPAPTIGDNTAPPQGRASTCGPLCGLAGPRPSLVQCSTASSLIIVSLISPSPPRRTSGGDLPATQPFGAPVFAHPSTSPSLPLFFLPLCCGARPVSRHLAPAVARLTDHVIEAYRLFGAKRERQRQRLAVKPGPFRCGCYHQTLSDVGYGKLTASSFHSSGLPPHGLDQPYPRRCLRHPPVCHELFHASYLPRRTRHGIVLLCRLLARPSYVGTSVYFARTYFAHASPPHGSGTTRRQPHLECATSPRYLIEPPVAAITAAQKRASLTS